MDVKKLLYATDLEEEALSFNKVKRILSMAESDTEEILFLQTAPSESWLKELSGFNIKSNVLIEEKLSSSRILSTAVEKNVSLIIINLDMNIKSPSRSSIFKKLIKKTSLPILFFNRVNEAAEPDNKKLFNNVIFPTDWSSASQKALDYLLDYKKNLRELEIINVINRKLTIKDMRELREKLAQTRKICLDEQVDAESHIYAGKTSEEILIAARDYKATIIVMGRKSLNPAIKKKSSIYKVVEESTVPVLVVP